jgi:hypothetical protein
LGGRVRVEHECSTRNARGGLFDYDRQELERRLAAL